MVKSSAPVFVVLFAFLFGIEKPSIRLVAVIGVIVFGVFLSVSHQAEFDLTGYLLIQFAAIFSGLRWALIQVLLEKEEIGMNNPLSTSLYLSPVMATSIFTACLGLENIASLPSLSFFETPASSLNMSIILILGGILAFLMLIAEYRLISVTSVVTFCVAGIFKEILTIMLSVGFFRDQLTALNIAGIVISLIGIGGYNYLRHQEKKENYEKVQSIAMDEFDERRSDRSD